MIHGPPAAADRGSLISFSLDGAHPHDIGEILGRGGVCIRAGHHCAQPLMRKLGVSATTRASFAVHNSSRDVDRLIDGLGTVRSVLQSLSGLRAPWRSVSLTKTPPSTAATPASTSALRGPSAPASQPAIGAPIGVEPRNTTL